MIREFIKEHMGHDMDDREFILFQTIYDLKTLEVDGEIIVVAGFSFNATGVCHFWACCKPGVQKKYPISYVKFLRGLDNYLKKYSFVKRIEIDIKADSDVDRNFVEFFGFHEESLMPMFGKNGETYAKYVRLQ